MNEMNPSTPELPENMQGGQETVQGDTVNITRGGTGRVEAKTVTVRQGGVQSAKADQIVVRQGGVVQAQADHIEILQGGLVYGRTQTANLTASSAVALVAGGDITMDQSITRVLVSGGNVNLDQSAAVAVIARSVRVQNSNPVLLLAQNVEGDVTPMFGPRESLMYGVASGLVVGVVILVAQIFKKRK
jgi:hypothetical protein